MSAVRGPELSERLRAAAENMEADWPRGLLDEAADEIERLEKQVFLHEDSWKEALTVIEKMRGMFRRIKHDWYFDGHRFSIQHGMVKLNEKGEETIGVR